MRNFLSLIFFLLATCGGFANVPDYAGDSVPGKTDSTVISTDCQQKDIVEVIFKQRVEKPASHKKVTALVVPYVSYSPVTKLQFGVGGSISWRLGHSMNTNLSASTVSANVTTLKQLIIQIKSNVYLNENSWFLQGDWRFYVFSLPTYGLGTMGGYRVPPVPGIVPDEASQEVTTYPMTFNWLKFHQMFSKKVRSHFYAGMGYHLDYHYMIRDLELKLDTPGVLITPHYAYCELNGFPSNHYTSSGISVNGVYDSRDNIINAYRGTFFHFNYRTNFKWMGSTETGSQLWAEFRTYVGLSKRMPRHLLAFWMYGSFHVSGAIPFLDLPSTGFDQMNSSGRGYMQGRWRGENLMYGEMEYRFPITLCSKIVGGVVFVNATTASNKELGINLFEAVKPAAGVGFRVMVSKRNRINVQVDFAWGVKADGFYINAQEAF